MTFQKAFDAIKQKFDNAAVNNISDFALQVTLSDEDCGGTFYIAVQGGVLDVAPYDYQDNTAVLDISKTDFTSLLSGKKSLQKVVDNGASLKGDASTIDSIQAIAATVAKKPAARKTTAKKATAAKTTTAKTTTAKTAAAPAKKAAAAKTTAKAAAPAKTAAAKTTKAAADKKTTK